jgi:nicotinamidase-related amidase
MPVRNHDLHGNAPESCAAAVVLVDVINDMEFEGGEALLEAALPMAERLARLAAAARAAGVPVIYLNDNFGRWRSNFNDQVEHCLGDGVRGEPVARLLRPRDDDYFILKPKSLGFFSTPLDTLLRYLGTRTLVLTGMDTATCVLYTAAEAHVRDFDVVVPPDCTASRDPALQASAMLQMEHTLNVRLIPSAALDLAELAARPPDA